MSLRRKRFMENFKRNLRLEVLDRGLDFITILLSLEKKSNELYRSIHIVEDNQERYCDDKEAIQKYHEEKREKARVDKQLNEIETLVKKIFEYIFKQEEDNEEDDEEGCNLTYDEIRADKIEEYYYIMRYLKSWDFLFENLSDFIIKACISLGEEKKGFLNELVDHYLQ